MIQWTNKQMDNLSLCNVRMKMRKEWLRLNHLRSMLENKKTPLPYRIEYTGSV